MHVHIQLFLVLISNHLLVGSGDTTVYTDEQRTLKSPWPLTVDGITLWLWAEKWTQQSKIRWPGWKMIWSHRESTGNPKPQIWPIWGWFGYTKNDHCSWNAVCCAGDTSWGCSTMTRSRITSGSNAHPRELMLVFWETGKILHLRGENAKLRRRQSLLCREVTVSQVQAMHWTNSLPVT